MLVKRLSLRRLKIGFFEFDVTANSETETTPCGIPRHPNPSIFWRTADKIKAKISVSRLKNRLGHPDSTKIKRHVGLVVFIVGLTCSCLEGILAAIIGHNGVCPNGPAYWYQATTHRIAPASGTPPPIVQLA
jgi:hypothetical protein